MKIYSLPVNFMESCKMTAAFINTKRFVETIKYFHTSDEFKSGSDLTAVKWAMSRLTLKKRIPAETENTNDGFWTNFAAKITWFF